MEIRLEGKVILVTGSTQGIGRAIAETLARSGAAGLLVTGREKTRGDAVAAELSRLGTPTLFVAADLGDPETPALLAQACIERFGRIDGLVNAAGLTDRASFLDASPEDWAALFAVNARAPFFLMQAAIADMRKRGQGGAIVNILSINAHCGSPELAVYSATKGALATLTKNAANAHRFDRIRVNGINVGWTDTPAERVMQAQTLGHGPGWLDAANAAQPFGRLLRPDDIANLAVFLLSDAAGPMTGAVIDQEQSVIGANR
ncbi:MULTISPECIES: SDR family oxidoreductase [unclassified Mesorhizobium]|uniref:SDR family oxidoreductase n=2 Tax=Mesorhizobium TaxID=68287 RepID=UPI000FD22ED9|nr:MULTISPECIES: SDR family oxidoreductase [unclassified Mesorhizobium]RUX05949.1 SDR family oxidoreductase [Mesorhizobium sp. M8A.F.Ca.ET.023.01.1.1]TGR47161.1 SDR family oxidoreductase [bacterium M00.F.Ca.ET.199.01.1.1]TGU36611.1 SDR family oxidoreductase [bacterium M00.F.Ca.ET.156.01.1.1]TGU89201.1 SDR family oxidoreductase [Mesorhizobium sp. M00.F.Ca.ET.151.01.1.1]TGV13528.1 SDR family oxidoreductase [Mesorhizobium sp. M8A.F.Ca.ET.173.01.1.1]TGV87801.1 SDR family oxidoreductase [Mesorhizo